MISLLQQLSDAIVKSHTIEFEMISRKNKPFWKILFVTESITPNEQKIKERITITKLSFKA
jgi:hypothetical protein